MVGGVYTFVAVSSWLIATQQAGDAVFERLDPPRRAAVVMALLGLTLVGLFLITFIMVGGHWARRLARHRPGQRLLNANGGRSGGTPTAPQETPASLKTDDTVLLERTSKETKVEP